LVTSESSAVRCEESGIGITVDGTDPGFYLAILSEPEPTVFLGGGVDIDGLADGYAFINLDCATQPATLDIIAQTEDRLEGIYTAEFFTGIPGPDCADLTNLGPVEVVFNVALTACE
ncbi:MAG: hypothetical protein AAF597_15065, partial [Bacteroidota bacterium]